MNNKIKITILIIFSVAAGMAIGKFIFNNGEDHSSHTTGVVTDQLSNNEEMVCF